VLAGINNLQQLSIWHTWCWWCIIVYCVSIKDCGLMHFEAWTGLSVGWLSLSVVGNSPKVV